MDIKKIFESEDTKLKKWIAQDLIDFTIDRMVRGESTLVDHLVQKICELVCYSFRISSDYISKLDEYCASHNFKPSARVRHKINLTRKSK